MSKPEFSRPFNLEHARAGAPYCCRDGHAAHILKWDRNVSDYPLLGVIRKSDDPRTWAITGSTTYGNHGEEYDCDLVMQPMGFIDGKPVFVGDEFIGHANTPCVVKAGLSSNFAGCRWPALAPVYPKTLMSDGDLVSNYYGGGPVSHEQEYQAWRRIANAAICHGIDNGYLLDPCEKQAISIKASSEDIARIMSAGTGRTSIQYVPTNESAQDVKRDLAIALAVRNACISRCEPIAGRQQLMRALGDIDLSAIIASVTGAKDAQTIDFSIKKGDIVYKKTWCEGNDPLEVVNVNWALKAAAVKLSPTGGTVVWPIEGMSKEQFPKDAKEGE